MKLNITATIKCESCIKLFCKQCDLNFHDPESEYLNHIRTKPGEKKIDYNENDI